MTSDQETFHLAIKSGLALASNIILTPNSKKKKEAINVMLICEAVPEEHPTEVYIKHYKLHLLR